MFEKFKTRKVGLAVGAIAIICIKVAMGDVAPEVAVQTVLDLLIAFAGGA